MGALTRAFSKELIDAKLHFNRVDMWISVLADTWKIHQDILGGQNIPCPINSSKFLQDMDYPSGEIIYLKYTY